MPPVFMQPGGDSGGGGGSYSQLASALQSRYAADAERQQRGQIAYQELADRRIAEQRNYELGAARLQLQPILQEQQARLEIDNWTMKQEFNAQDQAELNRQNAVVSELMDKRDKGEISDGEFYAKAKQTAWRVNLLQAKELHTKNAAMAEERKARAANFEDQIKMRDRAAAYQEQELEGKLDLYVPPRYASQLSQIMADAHPEMKSGTSEYSAQLKAEADAMGWAVPFAKDKSGTPIFQKDLPGYGKTGPGEGGAGQGTSRGGGDIAGAMAVKDLAFKAALEEAKLSGATNVSDELIAKHEKRLGAQTKEGKQAAAGEIQKEAVGKIEVHKDELSKMQGLNSFERGQAGKLLDEIHRLTKEYPPGRVPAGVNRRVNALLDQWERFQAIVNNRPKPAQAGEPAPQPGQDQGRSPLQWGQGFQTDVGNVVRGASRGLVDAGGAIASAPGEAWDAAKSGNPFPQSWQDYFSR